MMSTRSIQTTPEKLDFEEIIQRLSSLSRRLNEEMQSNFRANDQDQLKRSCDEIEGISKIATTVFNYFQKFEGDLQKSLGFLESDAEEIINQLPHHKKRNRNLSHYVYHQVNGNLRKAESSMQLLHEEVSKRKSRAVCARCVEEEKTRCRKEVSSEISKQSDLSEEIKRKLVKFSSTNKIQYVDVFDFLLPFIILPANTEVKRRLLKNVWIGLDADYSETPFQTFSEMGIINPVNMQGILFPGDAKSFKMVPLIQDVVTSLAKEANKAMPPIDLFFWSERIACLVQGKEFSYKNLDVMGTLFNVNEQFPDLVVTAEQLYEMKRLRILYPGSWETSTALAEHDPIRHHIEIEDINFLKAIENMISLRFLCLRGVSLISKLNVRKLTNLRTLDLKSCWNLIELPDEFESLKNLTYLDISGCYLLQHMPLSLATLSRLEVLKGFVISDQRSSCLLSQLPRGLTKLSIKIVVQGFDIERLPSQLARFEDLEILKIEWGTGPEVEHSRWGLSQRSRVLIRKLVLDGYPFKTLPSWVDINCLRYLNKLYIRGGNLINLGPAKRFLEVETLRLKYLGDFEMDWQEMGIIFPNLEYLERIECPRIASWPCDINGEWNSTE